jgi:hypothetical protein
MRESRTPCERAGERKIGVADFKIKCTCTTGGTPGRQPNPFRHAMTLTISTGLIPLERWKRKEQQIPPEEVGI